MWWRNRSLWGGLGLVALVALASSSRRPPAGRPPARRGGAGEGAALSYVVDPAGAVLTRSNAPGATWVAPRLEEHAAQQFRTMVEHWRELVELASADFRVPAATIFGIMWAESKGDPRARSAKGAMGLLQVMPFHWPEGTPESAMLDPRGNIRKGVQIMANARSRTKDLVELASYYNAGGPWTNASWLAAERQPGLTTRWGVPAEPGYIDTVVAASNTFLLGGNA